MTRKFLTLFKTINIRTKLASLVLLFTVLLFMGTTTFFYWHYKRMLIKEDIDDLRQDAVFLSVRLNIELASMKNYLNFIVSRNESLRRVVEDAGAVSAALSEDEVLARVQSLKESFSSRENIFSSPASGLLADMIQMSAFPFLGIFVMDQKGMVVTATDQPSDYYFGAEAWWKKISSANKPDFSMTETFYEQSFGRDVFCFTFPFFDEEGVFNGALRAFVDREILLKDIFGFYKRGEGDCLGVLSSDGDLIFGLDCIKKTSLQGLIRKPLKDQKIASVVYDRLGRGFFINFSKIDLFLDGQALPWYLYCFCNARDFLSPLHKALAGFFGVWLSVVLIFYSVFIFVLNKILDPLKVFQRSFDRIRKGDFQHRISVGSGDEFEELAQDLNLTIEELRKTTVSQDYFNRIVQSMSDILFVLDSQGKIVMVNRQMCETLGYSQEELIGKEAIHLFAKKDRYIINWGLKGLIEEGALKDKKVRLVAKGGREIDVYLGTRSLWSGEKALTGLVCLAKDLTEVSRLLDELKRSNEEALKHKQEVERSLSGLTDARDVMLSILEDVDESKKTLEATLLKLKEAQDELLQAEKMASLGQIAAGVAHEINNPLFVISGEAEILSLDEEAPASMKESVKTIREQVKRISEIIKRLLEFSRKRESRFGVVDINELLEKTSELLKYQAKISGQMEIVKHLSSGPLLVSGDQNQLQEVFLNLMINGIQAMEEKGGVLTIESFFEIIQVNDLIAQLKFQPGDEVVGVRIRDTGAGMDEETAKKIFDPFFTTKKTGTGLGLSVCFGIVESHSGLIQVDSQKEVGTTFLVRLRRVNTVKEKA